MSCTASQLLEDACDSKIACIGEKIVLWRIIAQAVCNSMGCDANSLLKDACASKIACISEETVLLRIIAQGLCAGGGGGGSGSTQVYTGAAPPAAPADPTKAAVFYPT